MSRARAQLDEWYEYTLRELNSYCRGTSDYDERRDALEREYMERRRQMEFVPVYAPLDPLGGDSSRLQNVWSTYKPTAVMERARSVDLERMRRAYDKEQEMIAERVKKTPPPPEERTESETKSAFLTMMGGAGFRKDLPIRQRIEHEMELGELEVVKAKREALVKKALKKAQPPPPKRLCGICGDPCCPWSD